MAPLLAFWMDGSPALQNWKVAHLSPNRLEKTCQLWETARA
jgi:hypothetical protein